MEHQLAMNFPEPVDQLIRFPSRYDAVNWH
jgi:hypothetical protein